jgi:hypothetical protein
MDIDVVILRDGSLSLMVRGAGDFTTASAELRSVLGALQTAGISLDSISAVERHRHAEAEETVAQRSSRKTLTS